MSESISKPKAGGWVVRALLLSLWTLCGRAEPGKVHLLRPPDGGIQPQAAVDSKGVLHLIYFKGQPQGGDVYYVRRAPGGEAFSTPIRINVQARSAIAMGTVRGAHLAIGRNGRVHVAWMGGDGAARAEVAGKAATPMMYTRMNDRGTAFEPERNLLTWAAGLDGGASVAADQSGNVYVAWHASPPGNTQGEAGRAVFVARSSDDGRRFQREERVRSKPTGACGCCGMRTYVDSAGRLYILYRGANDVSRDMTLLISRDHAASFETETVNQWMTKACPMSTCAFAEGSAGVLVATERSGQVSFNVVDPVTLNLSKATIAPVSDNCRHPTVAANAAGEVLMAWTEGTGWEKGGALAWQIFEGRPGDGSKRADRGRAGVGIADGGGPIGREFCDCLLTGERGRSGTENATRNVDTVQSNAYLNRNLTLNRKCSGSLSSSQSSRALPL
jgi:hypothetical protein